MPESKQNGSVYSEFKSKLKKGWQSLTTPASGIQGDARKREARLLSGLLLIIFAIVAIVANLIPFFFPNNFAVEKSSFNPISVSLICLGGLYLLSRTPRYHLTAILTVFATSILVLISAFSSAFGTQELVFYFFLIPILLSNLLLSLRLLIGVFVFDMLCILLFVLTNQQAGFENLLFHAPLLITIVTILLVIATDHRNKIEIDRQTELKDTLSLLTATLESTADAIVVVTRNGKVTWNQKFLEMWELSESSMSNRPIKAMEEAIISKVEDSKTYLQNTQILYEQPNLESFDLVKFKDGTIFELYTKPQRIGGVTVGRVWSFRDISWRYHSEQALAAEKEQLVVTLQSIGDGVITTDIEGRVVLLNLIAEKLTGWSQEEAEGHSLSEVFTILNQDTGQFAENPAQKVLETGRIEGLANNTTLIAKDGSHRLVADSAAPIRNNATDQVIGVVLVFRDVTEKHNMELEIQRTQKLESLGVLAGGIAHDFNNILTSVAGNIGLAQLEADDVPKVQELLVEAENAVFRAKELTQQLLTFAKGGAPVKKVASLSKLLEETTRFTLRGSKARSQFQMVADLWPVELDEGQIGQVINNLVLNADQAMPNGGTLSVTAENIPAYKHDLPLPLKNHPYVKVTFKDEGVGIPQKDMLKIFDPYFTTKPKGNGLGLATAFSIINKHQGRIAIESEVGKGTAFFIYLPASPASEVVIKPITPNEVKERKGRILLVDDEPTILTVGKRALERVGYEVDVALEGRQALELYRGALTHIHPYKVVIMDLTIPGGMGGKETIQHLLALDPHVKAVVASGYSNDPILANYRAYGFSAALVKPFKLGELSQAIEDAAQAN